METKFQTFQKNMLSLQEQLLQEALQKRKDITLILLKGLHVKGMIRGFDTYSVLMEFEGKQQLIYKHAISTIRF
ncbi:RNA chaperone Hfq [Bacillus toyonensis]|uniref:RNA chaperone Hfq n=1 Tax=Bacillus toyonensis TaxID=155322 RepID=UPI000CD932D7|nr:RNA chaperone Hfq [Bacillus toyonensis]MED3539371.1 RNA chaperone Hfq [Bacillus toyonensis]MEE2018649.1 RNA chaperone Hfq [Bacillus toyonensis]